MGFIPPARQVLLTNTTQRVTLSRLNQPGANGALMIDIPVSSTRRYVISYRTRVGYDGRRARRASASC